jgi:phosphoglycerate dehydrogenase-like enzyme
MHRIAIIDDYLASARRVADWSAVERRAQITVFTDHLDDPDALVARLASFDIVSVMRERTPFPRALLARLPRLRLMCSNSERNAAIDLVAARELGITVCGTSPPPGGTAELAWGLILALARQIPDHIASVRAGGWQVGLGVGLRGRTLGILGLGTIGTRVGRVGQAFGMEVIAWSPNLDAARAQAAGTRLVSKDELFRASDVLTLHIVLSERTRGIVGARELGLMKRSAFFVNTSRGRLVDEAALVATLEQGAIAGAALDAFAVEPLPADHPLRRLSNAMLTPHIGYVTEPGYRTFYGETVENILAFMDGRPIRVMNPAAGQNAAIPAFL